MKKEYFHKKLHLNSIIFSLLLLCLPLAASAQEYLTYDHNGIMRDYILYRPDNLPTNAPLVFVMHGYTGSAEVRMRASGMNRIADVNKFAVCYPQGLEDNGGTTHWNARLTISNVNDIGFLSELAKHLHTQYKLNPQHTFACGMSNGGFMSYTLACEASDIFRAVAPVTGLMSGYTWKNRNPSVAVPVLHIHGTADNIVPIDGSMSPGGGWGGAPALDSIISYWATVNNCATRDSAFFAPSTNAYYFRKGTNNKEVWYYKINGMGHTWPTAYNNTGTIASEVIWEFFKNYIDNTPILTDKTNPKQMHIITVTSNQMKNHLIIRNNSGQPFQYTLTSTNGKLLLSGSSNQTMLKVVVPELSPGLYLLNLECNIFNRTFKIQR